MNTHNPLTYTKEQATPLLNVVTEIYCYLPLGKAIAKAREDDLIEDMEYVRLNNYLYYRDMKDC